MSCETSRQLGPFTSKVLEKRDLNPQQFRKAVGLLRANCYPCASYNNIIRDADLGLLRISCNTAAPKVDKK